MSVEVQRLLLLLAEAVLASNDENTNNKIES